MVLIFTIDFSAVSLLINQSKIPWWPPLSMDGHI